ncbi:MAG: methyl-accepting chemotaxis protein, partial [Gammaproteobacteria bacterium]|nr:methyl-accepting chemotaxis protein [Gammaproteobacteria bacterium]
HTPMLLAASEALMEASGNTAALQEFQQRAARLDTTLSGLAASAIPGTTLIAVDNIFDDLGYLREVTNALSGEASSLDIAPLDSAEREISLVPVVSELVDIETRATVATASATNLDEIGSNLAALSDVAGRLQQATATASPSQGGLLQDPWLVLGCLAAGLALLIWLMVQHSRAAVHERASQEQVQQNERNQQAILRLLDEMGSLADGDLTVEATVTEDITGTIADSFNYAIEKLRELVATVNETAIMVDSAAKQTENTAAHMARATDNQGREIKAATESIVSMAASIEEVSGNAERSSDVARHSVEVAHKGGEAVRRTIDGMNAIRETIQDTSKRIKRLGESSQEIGNIIELINDIAEQTNILALNASIQASMAGEAGRGFAVVADEVQRLAERSTNATKQIEVLVRTIQADTNEAVVSMERSTTDVVGGALLAENAGAALDEIEQVSNQIANLVQNISGSARQQAGAAADVTRRTTKLREISEQTGQATTATAAAIAKLSELASQLRQSVAGFTLPNSALHSSALSGTSVLSSTGAAPQQAAQNPRPGNSGPATVPSGMTPASINREDHAAG